MAQNDGPYESLTATGTSIVLPLETLSIGSTPVPSLKSLDEVVDATMEKHTIEEIIAETENKPTKRASLGLFVVAQEPAINANNVNNTVNIVKACKLFASDGIEKVPPILSQYPYLPLHLSNIFKPWAPVTSPLSVHASSDVMSDQRSHSCLTARLKEETCTALLEADTTKEPCPIVVRADVTAVVFSIAAKPAEYPYDHK